jgi:cytosine/adenosine deaminase-related metal-dependent hydrolase
VLGAQLDIGPGPGKKADMIVHDLDSPSHPHAISPRIWFAAKGSDVAIPDQRQGRHADRQLTADEKSSPRSMR